MSLLHYQSIRGKAREILKAILLTPEVSSCGRRNFMLLRLACEEIVMNITSYAYPEGGDGFMDVEVESRDNRVVIHFSDGGTPFNPLEHKDSDINMPWKLRHVGGLGIFLILKKMDAVHYAYEDNKNVLTIVKVCS